MLSDELCKNLIIIESSHEQFWNNIKLLDQQSGKRIILINSEGNHQNRGALREELPGHRKGDLRELKRLPGLRPLPAEVGPRCHTKKAPGVRREIKRRHRWRANDLLRKFGAGNNLPHLHDDAKLRR